MVVLSAHLDGHALGESALDNATGVAAALCLARAMAPHVAGCESGLMLCLFGAEEWALAGSRAWLAAQPAERLARMRMNLNLDSVAGHGQLTALTSGFAELEGFLRGAWPALAVHEPLMANSDHANFAALGVPAARIIAGFNAPESNLRFLLTAADRRQLTSDAELRAATLAAARMLWAALTLSR
jgi:Zn-dependent M28 family amino/carboxypeptidase